MNEKIKCPNCSFEFDVEEALSNKIGENLKKEYENKLSEQLKKISEEKKLMDKDREDLNTLKEKHDEIIQQELKKLLKKESEKLSKSLNEENEEKIKSLEEENQKRKEENSILKQKQLDVLKRENELKEKEEEYKHNLEIDLLERQKEIEDRARTKEKEANEIEKLKMQKQMDDQIKLIEEMKRKAEQGSMQLQGESMELAIERYLKEQFPFDEIEEIKKGARGADCIQKIRNPLGQICGTIYFESKLTKAFQSPWLDKFKNDMQEKSADIGILVTDAMPLDMPRMGQRNGIWICNYEEFKGLVIVLRESIIQISNAVASQENRGDKMSLLYDFLTGNEFRQQIEAIVDGFTSLKSDLEKEKNAMARIWKTREKQIDKVLLNTTNMYGAIRGIGGNAIQNVKTLELCEPEISDDEE